MGEGRGQHVYLDDELGKLAGTVIARIAPNKSDRESREDCWQTAYVAGLMALSSARRAQRHTSNQYLMLAMQSAVYRTIRRARKDIREADLLFA